MAPLLLLCGCAGARCRITARTVESPVSCTGCVFDPQGRPHQTRPDELVSHFTLAKAHYAMLWTAVPLNSKEWDLSEELNSKIRAASGNAVVNVTIHATGGEWYFTPLIPILPDYVSMKVEGDIARIPDTQQ